jgi:hypothetical protein
MVESRGCKECDGCGYNKAVNDAAALGFVLQRQTIEVGVPTR